MLLNLFLFSSVQFQHIVLCASLLFDMASFISSFHHHITPLLHLPSNSQTPHHMPLNLHPCNVPTNFTLQDQLIQIIFLQVISRSSHLSANYSFFSQYLSFSLHSLFSSYLHVLPLAHVDTLQGLTSHFVKNNTPVFFSYQHYQFLLNFLPFSTLPSALPIS